MVTLGCISRLTWTYLFRCTESTSITFKKLDLVIKTLFPPFRRAVYPSDTPLDHFILITYFSLMRDVDTGTKKILFYLLNTEASSSSHSSHNWDLINPERMIIALSAFRLMLSDLERNIQKPPFPTDVDMTCCGIPISCTADVFSGPIRAVKPDVIDKVEEIISKTLTSLDQTFGRLLVLDEKNIIVRPMASGTSTNTSTTTANYSVPIFTNSAGPSDSGPQLHHQYASFSVSYTKDKQAYFDVIKTIIDCMPRIMPAEITLPRLVEILARYTVHTDPEIIKSASKALLRIAAQIDSQTVVTGFSRYISKIEDKFSEVVQSLGSGPITGGSHNGNRGIMKLYVDLLSIWVNQLDLTSLERPTNPNARGSIDVSIGKLLDLVEETEANGLLYLCNQSPSIRKFAIEIIQMASQLADRLNVILKTKADETIALEGEASKDKSWTRLSQLLESIGQDLIQFDKETNTLLGTKVSSEVRGRILQHQRRGLEQVLINIAESDHQSDLLIWNICLPEIFKLCFKHFPQTTAQCRLGICSRLLQIQPSILAWVETIKAGTTGTLSMAKSSSSNHKAASPETIEQWRIYLVFACATAIRTDSPTISLPIWSAVGRKGSANLDRISSPRDLFRLMSPYLTCEHRPIRESAIEGLGHINQNVYKSLMSELEGYVKIILDDGKQRNNQKPYQNKRSKKNDRLRISVMNVLELTAGCLSDPEAVGDKDLMNVIMSYIKETKSFLVDTEVQIEWEYQRLRIYLCGLVDKLYQSIMKLEDPTSLMSFETRLSLYKMFEEWCGYGASAKTTQQREATMIRDVLEQCKDPKERASMTQLIEDERKALESASLSAMATLCVNSFMEKLFDLVLTSLIFE